MKNNKKEQNKTYIHSELFPYQKCDNNKLFDLYMKNINISF